MAIQTAKEELRRATRALRVLSAGNRAMVRAAGEQELYEEICRAISDSGGYPLAWIALARADDTRSVQKAADSGLGTPYLQGIEVSWGDSPSGNGPIGLAIRTGQAVAINDAARDIRFRHWRERATPFGFKSVAAMPLRAANSVFGALIVYATEADAFQGEELELLEQLAEDLSSGIELRRLRQAQAEAERLAFERAAEFRDIFDSTNDAIYICGFDGRFLEVNQATCRHLGYSREELLSMKIPEIDSEESAALLPARLASIRESGTACFESVQIRKDGTPAEVELNIRRIRYRQQEALVGVGRDINGRKRAEAILANETRIHQAVFSLLRFAGDHLLGELLQQTLDEVCALTSSRIGFYHFVSEDEQTLSLQAWSKATLRDYCRADGRNLHYDLAMAGVWADCVRERKAVVHNDYARLAHRRGLPAGHAELLRELVAPVFRQGRIVAILGVGNKVTDYSEQDVRTVSQFGDLAWVITEHKRANEAVKAREADLLKAKNAAEAASHGKSEFLARMSHEIRTPLNGMIGMTELVLQTPLTSGQREDLTVAKDSAESLLTVINDILDFSKVESGKLELERIGFNLPDAILNAVKPFAFQAQQKGIQLICEVDPAVPVGALGDPGRLRQVLVNLIGNAVKFTERGEVVVRMENARSNDDTSAAHEFYIHCAVTDTGIGIPSEKQEKIFDSFTQADGSITRRFGGTGLGLAISSRLVEMMGGRIWVNSSPERAGSAFHFTARLEQDATAMAPPLPQSENLARLRSACAGSAEALEPGRPLHILLAEDNPINQRLALRLLQSRGHQVTLAHNGANAVATWKNERFDLVLMDLEMPEMDGLAATEAIRKHEKSTGKHIPIVAMTAHAMRGDQERCVAAGMDSYLSKPIRPAELYHMIDALTA